MSVINGSGHSDYLNGTSHSDSMYGNGGNDIVMGNEGNDVMYGGAGNDTFFQVDDINFIEKYWGTSGADTMYGGQGNDSYLIENSGDKVIENAGEGTDAVYSVISYTLPANVEKGYLIKAGVKDLNGNDLNNNITGNCFANHMNGYGGDDYINGGGYGKDTLDGGDGNDNIKASRRDCELYGSNGKDILTSWFGDDTLSGGSGNDSYKGFTKDEENQPRGHFLGFGHDVIKDYMDYGHNSDNTQTGSDFLDLSKFTLGSISIYAKDIDHDGNFDALYINCGKYGTIEIDKYFDDSSHSLASSKAGIGCIEDIAIGGQHLHFDDIQHIA